MKYYICHSGISDAEEFSSFDTFVKRLKELSRKQEQEYESDLLEEDVSFDGFEFTVTVGDYE